MNNTHVNFNSIKEALKSEMPYDMELALIPHLVDLLYSLGAEYTSEVAVYLHRAIYKTLYDNHTIEPRKLESGESVNEMVLSLEIEDAIVSAILISTAFASKGNRDACKPIFDRIVSELVIYERDRYREIINIDMIMKMVEEHIPLSEKCNVFNLSIVRLNAVDEYFKQSCKKLSERLASLWDNSEFIDMCIHEGKSE